MARLNHETILMPRKEGYNARISVDRDTDDPKVLHLLTNLALSDCFKRGVALDIGNQRHTIGPNGLYERFEIRPSRSKLGLELLVRRGAGDPHEAPHGHQRNATSAHWLVSPDADACIK